MENPIQMDDLGVPLFSETPMYYYIIHYHLLDYKPSILGVFPLFLERPMYIIIVARILREQILP